MFSTFNRSARVALWLTLTTATIAPGARAQQPDNTQVNKQDRSPSQVTADQQKNDRSDLTITRDIRRSIVADKSLSTYAHNVKVITQHGDVTLKGPVRTEEEKQLIETKATEIAGTGHVNNQLSIAPGRAAKPKA